MYANFYHGVENFSPKIQSSYFVTSTPHVFQQYKCIFGLTGSIGGPAEKEYLSEVFQAKVFSVPTFLDTCTQAESHKQECQGVDVFSTVEEQTRAIIKTCNEKHKDVPILVICATPPEATLLFTTLKGKLDEPDALQLFLEVDENGRRGNHQVWDKIVSKATEQLSSNHYRITITDYFGGRGVDYRITDERVDENGGFLIVVTAVPDSEREWVQWKGRTARQDHKGQYNAFLVNTQAPLKDNWTEICEIQPPLVGEKLMEKLLTLRDGEIKVKLTAHKQGLKDGMRANALCDNFYRTYTDPLDTWPPTPKHKMLRDFFDKHGSSPTEAVVREFSSSVGL